MIFEAYTTVAGLQMPSRQRGQESNGSRAIPPITPAAVWMMNVAGAGSGTVTSSPSGIACGGHDVSCAGLFAENTSITFTATPASGHSFGGWGGACSGVSSTCVVSGVGAQTVYATFNGPPVITYYHADVLGSVRAITDGSGATVTRLDYAPFGESTATLTGDSKKFLGQDRDAETAFDYLGARYYRNVWGRFASADDTIYTSSTDPQTFNLYSNALNNPLRYVDPEGHQAREPQAPPCTPNNCTTVTENSCTGRCRANEIQLRIDGLILFWQGPRNPVTGELYRGNGELQPLLDLITDGTVGPYLRILGDGLYGTNGASGLDYASILPFGRVFGFAAETSGRTIGITAANGTRITQFTTHGIDRAIGDTMSRAGVSPQRILDTLRNPLRITERMGSDGRPVQVFVGETSRVVVNPVTGAVISVNRR